MMTKSYEEWYQQFLEYYSSIARIYGELQPTDSDIVWANAVIHFLQILATEDPGPIYFRLARDYLEKEKILDAKAVDLLARELCMQVSAFRKFAFKDFIKEANEQRKLEEILLPSRDFIPSAIFETNECNLVDFLFCMFLERLGKVGKEAALAIKKDSVERQLEYRKSGYAPELRPNAWCLWVSKKTIFAPSLKMLTEITWKDRCQTVWKKKEQYVPALTGGVYPSIVKLMSHKHDLKQSDDKIRLLHDEKEIAVLSLPIIDPKTFSTVSKGIGNINSLYHHKLIRFECRLGFENWVLGKADVRLLKFPRGYSEIAEHLGFNNNKAIEEIKNLLHAQAFFTFHFNDGSSGNLIVLNKFRSSLSGREEGISIILGDQLLPHYTFEEKGKHSLLIPIPELPPLVSSSNSHGSQATLQMLIMREFSSRSVEFSEIGSIEIDEKCWESLAKEANLSKSVFTKVLYRWLNDGDDGGRFLRVVEPDKYTLGEAYSKENSFFKSQGSLRKIQSIKGKKSANVRRKV